MRKYLQICVWLQAVTVLYSASISNLLRRPPNPQILEDSLKLYNAGLKNSSFLFKLLIVDSHSQADSHGNLSVTFVIKETVCPKSAETPGECPFKDDGVMKNCTAIYSGPPLNKTEISCQTMDPPVSPSEGDEEKLSRGHRRAKFINSGKKNETTFLDVNNKNLIWSHLAASCLPCIFKKLPEQ
ncbi:lutzicidin-like [Mantella aurantiaca]